MRCYFHLVNGHTAVLDDTGVDVSDIEIAQRQALQAIRELQQQAPHQIDEDWEGWQLNIIDQSGGVLLSIRLNTSLS